MRTICAWIKTKTSANEQAIQFVSNRMAGHLSFLSFIFCNGKKNRFLIRNAVRTIKRNTKKETIYSYIYKSKTKLRKTVFRQTARYFACCVCMYFVYIWKGTVSCILTLITHSFNSISVRIQNELYDSGATYWPSSAINRSIFHTTRYILRHSGSTFSPNFEQKKYNNFSLRHAIL